MTSALKLVQKRYNKVKNEQLQQHAKQVKKHLQMAAKLRSMQSMKAAGEIPRNLQLPVPTIHGEGMEAVQQAAVDGIKQLQQQLFDKIITEQTRKCDAASAEATATFAGGAAAAVTAAFTVPAHWTSQVHLDMHEQVRAAALMELDLQLTAGYDNLVGAAQRKQQQAQEKAAKAAAAAADAAPLTAEQQMRKIAAEEAKKLLKKQKQPPPAAAPAAAGAQQQPRKQRAQQQQQPAAAQGRPRPAGQGGRPKQQQQQQQQQRPQQRRQGPSPSYAAAARGPSNAPVNTGQPPRRQKQGPRF
jgi:hypothetical protein